MQAFPHTATTPLVPDHEFYITHHDPLGHNYQLEATLKLLRAYAYSDKAPVTHRGRLGAFLASARHACLASLVETLVRAQFGRSLQQQMAVRRALAGIMKSEFRQEVLTIAGEGVAGLLGCHEGLTWQQRATSNGTGSRGLRWGWEVDRPSGGGEKGHGEVVAFGRWVRDTASRLLGRCEDPWMREVKPSAGGGEGTKGLL